MNTHKKIIIWIIGVGAFILAMLIILSIYINGHDDKIAQNMGITVTQQDDATGLTQVTYSIKNRSTKSHILDSIDIDLDAFTYGELIGVDTEHPDEYTLYGMRTFEFKKEIAPDETKTIIFTFKKKSSDAHLIETDICVNSAATCVGRSFNI